jgi:tetratricopeptide (TPR) repeat protein
MGLLVTAILQERWDEVSRIQEQMLRSDNPFLKGIGAANGAGGDIARGRMRAAVEQFERALSVPGLGSGPRAAVRNRMAAAFVRQGRMTEAVRQLEAALPDARGQNPEIETLSLLAVALSAEARTAEADKVLADLDARARLMQSNRDLRRVHWARGEILRRRGDARGSLPEFLKAIELLSANAPALGPQQPHLDVLLSAALAHREAGNQAEAIQLLERMQTRHERALNPEAWVRSFYLLGDLYEARGDAERARQQYRRFVDLWGDGELERGWVARARGKVRN